MKLQPDKAETQIITGHGKGWFSVNGQRIEHSAVVGWDGQLFDWKCNSVEDLTAEHFAQLAELDAELVLFGSGSKTRFPKGEWLKSLMARRIGIETMDTAAACRTYNILAGEGRKVIAALLIDDR